MKIKFMSYFDVREYFNKNHARLNKYELNDLLKEIYKLRETQIFTFYETEISSLIEEVEIAMEEKSDSFVLEKRTAPVSVDIKILKPSNDANVSIKNLKSTNLLWEVERETIRQALLHCEGNRTNAAKFLGVSVRTLRNKIYEYIQL